MTGRRMVLAVLGLGLLGSQAGHLLAYQIRFGASAQQIQSPGAPAYFPLVAKAVVGVLLDVVGAIVPSPLPPPLPILSYAASDHALLTSRIAWSDLAKRGPPSSLRISSF